MAHKTVIAEWLFRHKQSFDLIYKDFQWPKDYGLKLLDFECQINFRGNKFVGRGTDFDEEIALEKASAEAIERALCSYCGIGTVGVAVHSNAAQAKLNSEREALERFSLSWHLENQVPFKKLYLDGSDYKEILSDCRDSVNFYEMKSPAPLVTTLCVIDCETQSFLGLDCNDSFERTTQKSFFEAIRNLAAFKDHPTEYVLQVSNNPDLWCGDSKFVNKVKSLIINQSKIVTLPQLEVKTEILSVEEVFEEKNIPFVVAKSTLRSVSS